jgi:hypothetical protein
MLCDARIVNDIALESQWAFNCGNEFNANDTAFKHNTTQNQHNDTTATITIT